MWSPNDFESTTIDPPETEVVKDKMEASDVNRDDLTFLGSKFWWNWIGSGARRGKLMFWKTDSEFLEHQAETSTSSQNSKPTIEDAAVKFDKEEPRSSFTSSAKETLKAVIIHFGKKLYRRISFIMRHTMQIIGSFQKLWVSRNMLFFGARLDNLHIIMMYSGYLEPGFIKFEVYNLIYSNFC